MGRHWRDEAHFRILFVCTGNICRSPFAEILTRHLLIARLGPRAAAFEVSSAGVQAVVGSAVHPSTRVELAPWGLDRGPQTRHFTARQLRSTMVTGADLVLGASTQHRSAVIECEPAGLATSFSLREFARLAQRGHHAEPDDRPDRERGRLALSPGEQPHPGRREAEVAHRLEPDGRADEPQRR